jgi:hypothetical protein
LEESSIVDCPPEDIARSAPERLSLGDLRHAGGLTDEDDPARGVAAWADSLALVRTAEAIVDGRHGPSVVPPWRRFRGAGTCARPRAFEGGWAAVGRDTANVTSVRT